MPKVQDILDSAEESFLKGNLDKALVSLAEIDQEALTLGQKQSVQLLISKSLIKKGRFLGVMALVEEGGEKLAHFYTQELSQANGNTLRFYIARVDYYLEIKKFKEALASLEEALTYANRHGIKADIILLLCMRSQVFLAQNQFDTALESTESAYKIMLENGLDKNELLLAEIFFQWSQIYVKKQEYTKTKEYSQSLLEIARRRKDVEKELVGLNNLAVYHAVKSDYKTAMKYFLEALERGKKIGHRPISAQALINIGTIYGHLDNQLEAERRYLDALNDYEDVLSFNTRVITNNNLGNAALAREQFVEARAYFTRALDLASEVNYHEMQAHSAAQLSRVFVSEGDWELAKEFATKATDWLKDLGDLNGRQINQINLGAIAYHEKNYDQAMILTSQGIAASKRMRDDNSEIRGYRILANIYRELGDFEQALQYQTVYSDAQERYLRERRNRQVIDMEIKYAIREKQTEIEQLTKENEYQSLLLQQNDHISNKNAQLTQVNEELRQFAYVASHDLKEPLRMIGSYTQLIHRRHKDQFDEESTSFFNYVSEGVSRMNTLLDALLRYATIGKSEEDFEWVDLNQAVELAVINLRVRIEETGAEISTEEFPKIYAIKSLLIQLFQNLLANAIKFRKKDVIPSIDISLEDNEAEHIIRVADNGIGIAKAYQERIFVIFQRLHTRVEYQGAGIGLSICLKIVQRLNGRIWVESEEGKGATFCIAIPKPNTEVSIPEYYTH